MGNFNRGDRGNRFGRPQMHKAVCSACGKTCEVPFKPTGDKPVYCSNCFEKNSGGDRSNRRPDRSGFGNRNDRRDKQMFKAVCSTCGKTCEVPFRPTRDKPIYCDSCFNRDEKKGGDRKNREVNNNGDQFDVLNAKLDKLINLLLPEENKSIEKKELIKKAPAKKIVAKKVVVKKPVKKGVKKK